MKRCAKCGETKSVSGFHRSRLRRDGVQVYCKDCRAEIDHERYERRTGRPIPRHPQKSADRGRSSWLRSLKTGKPCADCEKVFPGEVMQWDHLPGFQKLGDISLDFRGHSREEILAEIAKCDLVCTNCHTIRTFSRNGWGRWSVREKRVTYAASRMPSTAA